MRRVDDETLTQGARIAYFSMEIALRPELPLYAGGLGVLAGDTLRAAVDMRLPMVGISLVSRSGYFRQELDHEGRQVEHPAAWEPAGWTQPLGAKVVVPIEGRDVWIGAWLYLIEGHMGGRIPVILLDTRVDENRPDDQIITDRLYGGDTEYRMKQEIVLGIGGVRMLYALGFAIQRFHMNEGHSAFLTLELLRRRSYSREVVRTGESPYDIPSVRDACIFTTHTPVDAGHDQFSYDMTGRVLGEFIDWPTLKAMAGQDSLNMTRLALNLSNFVNGVAKRHVETSRELFPGYRLSAITNGVHAYTWTGASFAALYDRYHAGWCHEPELLDRADQIPDTALWQAHQEQKQRLIIRVQDACGVGLDPALPTLGFARRMTAYKRPDLLFSDVERLQAIARRQPFQLVIAGKAHPRDEGGKQLIEILHGYMRQLAGTIPIAYLPDYNMASALDLVAGTDVWLNTPLPPLEASGTSGMKAAFNGVPSLSVMDGWWAEGCLEGVTGWTIGDNTSSPDDHAGLLYDKLENVILPLYRNAPDSWTPVMKGAITKNASYFNSHRMMRRYATEAYL